MSNGFDKQSITRIARSVQWTEATNPVGTKRQRRPGLSIANGLVIVRLLEDIPRAFWTHSGDTFYEKIDETVAAAEKELLQELSESEITALATELTASQPTQSIGSGLALVCEISIEPEIDVEPGQRSETIKIVYSSVVRVYNAHPIPFIPSISDRCGALGAGFCTATVGPDGNLYLVNLDRTEIFRINQLLASL